MSLQSINTAILSYGMSGEIFHAPLLTAHKGFQLTTILERSKDKARLRYPATKIVRSIDEILKDDAIELVIVNTPHESHLELTTRVLEAGKHAVVEKPFVISSAEGEELITLAKRKNLVLTAFQNRRWDGDFKTVKKVLSSGVLGKVVEFEAHYDRYRPEVDRSTWKELKGVAAGILYNLGSHLIDQALDLFGMPESVTALTGIQREGGEAEDFYDIRMKYPQHYVTLKSSYLVREHGPRYIIHGVKGSFIKNGLDPQEQALKEGGLPGALTWGTESSEWWGTLNTEIDSLHYTGKVETLPGNYLEFYDAVYAAVREGKEPVVTAREATNVIKIIELVTLSSKEGRTISL